MENQEIQELIDILEVSLNKNRINSARIGNNYNEEHNMKCSTKIIKFNDNQENVKYYYMSISALMMIFILFSSIIAKYAI